MITICCLWKKEPRLYFSVFLYISFRCNVQCNPEFSKTIMNTEGVCLLYSRHIPFWISCEAHTATYTYIIDGTGTIEWKIATEQSEGERVTITLVFGYVLGGVIWYTCHKSLTLQRGLNPLGVTVIKSLFSFSLQLMLLLRFDIISHSLWTEERFL